MNLKFTLFFAALFALPLSGYALTGGPFDNNDYSAGLDNAGIYQTAIRFKNGSGFSQWGNNVSLTQPAVSAATPAAKGSYLNRSVIYCNGLTYFGMATGMVDHTANTVMGYTNGTRDGTATSGTGNPVVTNANASTANTQWKAKITTTAPQLRYSGKGEITILEAKPANATTVTGLLQTALADALTAINAGSLSVDPNAGPAETTQQMISFQQKLLRAQLQAVKAFTPSLSDTSSGDNGFAGPITVYGARIFFIGAR